LWVREDAFRRGAASLKKKPSFPPQKAYVSSGNVLGNLSFWYTLPCPIHFRVLCGNGWDTQEIQVYTLSQNVLAQEPGPLLVGERHHAQAANHHQRRACKQWLRLDGRQCLGRLQALAHLDAD